MAEVISFADRYVHAMIKRLAAVQAEIDENARGLLGQHKRKPNRPLEDSLYDLDEVMKRLSKMMVHVESEEISSQISSMCRAYTLWSRAKLGSEAERKAALAYLENLDALLDMMGVG